MGLPLSADTADTERLHMQRSLWIEHEHRLVVQNKKTKNIGMTQKRRVHANFNPFRTLNEGSGKKLCLHFYPSAALLTLRLLLLVVDSHHGQLCRGYEVLWP